MPESQMPWCCLCGTRHSHQGRCPEHRLPIEKEMWPGLYWRMVRDGLVKDFTYVG